MGEYEPQDSRNVTGTAATPDGRWTNKDGKPPLAPGEPAEVKDGDRQTDPRADAQRPDDPKRRGEET